MNAQQPSVIEDLLVKITEIMDVIKEGKVDAFVFENLSKNAKLLQDKVNELREKQGIYNQSDIDDAYALLQKVKRDELSQESKKSMKRLLSFTALGLAVIFGAYILFKMKNNDRQ